MIVCGGNALSGIGDGLVQTTLPHPEGGGVFGRAPGGKPKFLPRKRAAASAPVSVIVFTDTPLNCARFPMMVPNIMS